MKTIRFEKLDTQTAIAYFDTPQSTVNVLSYDSLLDFAEVLKVIDKDSAIKVCILASAKEGCFIAGADLNIISSIKHQKQASTFSQQAQTLMQQIKNHRVVFVAAIDGSALGGGLELALACHLRIATKNEKTVFALPEVQLGLLPGACGTQYLWRLIGLKHALPMLLSGNRIRAQKAYSIGLVDALVESGELLSKAQTLAFDFATKKQPAKPLTIAQQCLEWPLLRHVLIFKLKKQITKKTKGHYPAPLAIIACVQAGLNKGLEEGLKLESTLFGQLVCSTQARHLMWIFHTTQALKKNIDTAESVDSLAVIGAGLMGEGIASVSLNLSRVIIHDIQQSTLDNARKHLIQGLEKRHQTGALSLDNRDKQQKNIHTSTQLADIAKANLVIEAVFEKLTLKQNILAQVEAIVSPSTVFASNTSALPISQIAAYAKHPERVLGMHYFSPVHKMPLLEIIVTEKTSKQTMDTAINYGIKQGKTVIVVKDSPGFYTTRILAPLLNEAMLLLEEGVSIERIDKAMRQFGFPVGPLALLDEVGIDVAAHVAHDLGLVFGVRWQKVSNTLIRIFNKGFAGKKNKKGFYLYPKKKINPAITAIANEHQRTSRIKTQDIQDRIVAMMVIESIYCLQEQVIRSPEEGDIGAIMGLGFPPFLGGPFHWVDSRGVSTIIDHFKRLASIYGSRFDPPTQLFKLQKEDKNFYVRKNTL